MWRWLGKAVRECVDWLLPPACQLCAATLPECSALELCASCLKRIPPIPAPRCPHCLLPHATPAGGDYPCEVCLRDPLPLGRVTALGMYDGALREAVHRFKFRNAIGLQRPLGTLLAQHLAAGDPLPARVVPVPLHRTRLRQRTYNQAQLLAAMLARHLPLEMDARLLVRAAETLPQQQLPLEERRSNVRGAFSVTRRLEGESLLLVDDVMTSGATVRSCATALLKAGAARVDLAILARAPRHAGENLSAEGVHG